ncbi:MAG: putative enzyme Histone deacetylase superfamily [Gammaproteobacteria bacterium]|jgi:acetoin utilization deacetylase AcuC-like enzyme|nr:putative enzyme Histone deacetylase superfamily [Gammaproteobacteria bacterium]
MTTSYITHADCLRHEMGPGHPECPERLVAVNEHMRSSGLLDQLRVLDAPLASQEDLKRVHRPEYVDLIFENAPTEGYVQLDPDTVMNPYTLDAARRAAGAGILAVDELMAGRSSNAFCAVRPCGHHATTGRPMGFCLFNNIGVAAAYAIEKRGLERVAIVDFDVHHGNGTEDMFSAPGWQDRVLMVSFFQHPFYPGSGTEDPAPNMINIPLAAGSDGQAARRVMENQWLPALHEFKPQMVLISAGFDAHREDLLGGLALVEEDYEWMTRELLAVARQHSDDRIVSMLEGGYNFAALGRSAVAHVRALAEG